MYNLVDIFTMLCSYYHCLIPEHFHHLPTKNLYLLVVSLHSPFFPNPQLLGTTHLLSISMDLLILDMSNNGMIHILLWPGIFQLAECFKLPPCFSMNFIPFYCWIVFHCTEVSYFVSPFICQWKFGVITIVLHGWAKAIMKTWVSNSQLGPVFTTPSCFS